MRSRLRARHSRWALRSGFSARDLRVRSREQALQALCGLALFLPRRWNSETGNVSPHVAHRFVTLFSFTQSSGYGVVTDAPVNDAASPPAAAVDAFLNRPT